MAITINTNVMSLNAQRNLGKSQGSLANSMQRLSSGLRINSAKDDAAGLAISDRMTAQIRGLNQAARNANDGISLAQTAEGALQESTNILQRMRELAVQSANDTNSASDRASLNDEVTQLKAELDRIAETSEFNGRKVIDGSLEDATFQVGANAGTNQTISFNIESALAADLSQVGTKIVGGTTEAGVSVSGTAMAEGDLLVNSNEIRATDGTAADTVDAINEANANGVAGVADIATLENVQSFEFAEVDLGPSTVGEGTTPSSVTAGTDQGITEETAAVTFTGLGGGQSYTMAGRTVSAVGGDLTADEVALAFSTGAAGDTQNGAAGDAVIAGNVTDWTAGTAAGADVEFTSTVPDTNITTALTITSGTVADPADLATTASVAQTAAGAAVGSAPANLTNSVTITQTAAGSGSADAVFDAVFEDLAEGATMEIGGLVITATGGTATAADVAAAFRGEATVNNANIGGSSLTGYVMTGVGTTATFTTDTNRAETYVDLGVDHSDGIATVVEGDGGTAEVASVVFGALVDGESYTLAGRTVTATGGDLTADNVADAFRLGDTNPATTDTIGDAVISGASLDAGTLTGFTVADGTVAGEIIITGDANGDLDPSVTGGGGSVATAATFDLTFTALAEGESFTLDGRTVTADAGGLTDDGVAAAFATADGTTAYTDVTNGDGTISGDLASFTATALNEVVSLTSTGTGPEDYTDVGLSYNNPSIVTLVEGDGSTAEVTDVTFGALTEGQSFTLDSRTVTATDGDLTAAEVALAFRSGSDGDTQTGAGGDAVIAGNLGTNTGAATADADTIRLTGSGTGAQTLAVTGDKIADQTALSEGSGITTTDGGVVVNATASSFEVTGITAPATVNGIDIQVGGEDVEVDWDATGLGAFSSWDDVSSVGNIVTVLNAQDGISAAQGTTAADILVSAENSGAPTVATTLTTGTNALTVTTVPGDYSLTLDGADVTIAGESDGIVTSQDVVDAFGATDAAGVAGFSAALTDDGSVAITKTDGSSFTLQEGVDPTGSAETNTGGLAGVISTTSTVFEGQVSLNDTKSIVLEEATTGALASVGLETVGNATTSIDQVSVDSRENAWVAIESVDAALADVDTIRGGLGAVQNRFESTIANLNNVAENLSAARSRILDADIAMETSAMTKANILQQAGVSILAQANQAPQLALSLLG